MNGKGGETVKRRTWIAWVIVGVLLIGAIGIVFGLGNSEKEAETELVRSAVKNAALSCYAVEGAFPESVDYLRERYGLVYDESRYIVVYDAFASNILPDIRVLEKGVTGR